MEGPGGRGLGLAAAKKAAVRPPHCQRSLPSKWAMLAEIPKGAFPQGGGRGLLCCVTPSPEATADALLANTLQASQHLFPSEQKRSVCLKQQSRSQPANLPFVSEQLVRLSSVAVSPRGGAEAERASLSHGHCRVRGLGPIFSIPPPQVAAGPHLC